MAGAQISTSVTIINSLLGFQAISLTEFDTSAESSIAAGSKVEIASAFFTFATDESISGFSSITTGQNCFVAVTPAGTAGSQTVTAAWTEAAPVWVDSKQGYYASAGSSVRYVANAVKTGASSCEHTHMLPSTQGELAKVKIALGAWDMDATTSLTVVCGIDTPSIVSFSISITDDLAVTTYYGTPMIWDGGSAILGMPDYDEAREVHGSNEQFTLTRLGGSLFDNTDFNSTAVNRGYAVLQYEVKDA